MTLIPSTADLSGMRFSELTALRVADPINYKQRWECLCDCGKTVTVYSYSLRVGSVKSCGCRRIRSMRQVAETHGLSKSSSSYAVWCAIRDRCRRRTHHAYHRYGGRGIKVCERWDSFESFCEDMGERPSMDHSIDRIDNDGHYEPGNCRWATKREQNNNTAKNVVLTVCGVSRTAAQWSRILNIRDKLIYERIAYGWSDEDALFRPAAKKSRKTA